MADCGFSYDVEYNDGSKSRISAVFDGVSGQEGSSRASAIAKEIFELGIYSGAITTIEDAAAFCEIADTVLAMMNFKDNPALVRSLRATTVALTMEYGGILHALHAGDSRWRVFRNGEIVSGSTDHIFIRDALDRIAPLMESGDRENAFQLMQMAFDELDAWALLNHMEENGTSIRQLCEHALWHYQTKAIADPGRIMSCLGSAFGKIDIESVKLEQGDIVALYSDGISGVLCEHKIADAFTSMGPGEVMKRLLDLAQERSAKITDRAMDECGCMVKDTDDDKFVVAYRYSPLQQEGVPKATTLKGVMPEGRMK
jgi:serine/threonine protein phosphatase PrpC